MTLSLVVWTIAAASALLSAGVGASLAYHWFRFGVNRTVAISALIAFSLGSLILLSLLFALAAAL